MSSALASPVILSAVAAVHSEAQIQLNLASSYGSFWWAGSQLAAQQVQQATNRGQGSAIGQHGTRLSGYPLWKSPGPIKDLIRTSARWSPLHTQLHLHSRQLLGEFWTLFTTPGLHPQLWQDVTAFPLSSTSSPPVSALRVTR